MEIEHLLNHQTVEKYFNYWQDETMEWIEEIGLNDGKR